MISSKEKDGLSEQVKDRLKGLFAQDNDIPAILLGIPFCFEAGVNKSFFDTFKILQSKMIDESNIDKLFQNIGNLQDTLIDIEDTQPQEKADSRTETNRNEYKHHWKLISKLTGLLNKISNEDKHFQTCFCESFHAVIAFVEAHCVFERNFEKVQHSNVEESGVFERDFEKVHRSNLAQVYDLELYERNAWSEDKDNIFSSYRLIQVKMEVLSKKYKNLMVVQFEKKGWGEYEIQVHKEPDVNGSIARTVSLVKVDNQTKAREILRKERFKIQRECYDKKYQDFLDLLNKAHASIDPKKFLENWIEEQREKGDPYANINQIHVVRKDILNLNGGTESQLEQKEIRRNISCVRVTVYDAVVIYPILEFYKNMICTKRLEYTVPPEPGPTSKRATPQWHEKDFIVENSKLEKLLNRSNLGRLGKRTIRQMAVYAMENISPEKRIALKEFFKSEKFPEEKEGWKVFKEAAIGDDTDA